MTEFAADGANTDAAKSHAIFAVRRASWRKAAFAAMALACIAALPVLSTALAQPPAGQMPDAAHGKQVFDEYCAACHNKLEKVGSFLVDDSAYFVRAGVPAVAAGMLLRHPVRMRPEGSRMPAYTPDEISDQDLDDVGYYLASFTPEPDTPPALGSASAGAGLYAKHCAACHGAKGEGVGKMLPLAFFANDLKQNGVPPSVILGFVMLSARSGSVPKMPTFSEERLSDTDLADIAAFIWEMPLPSGKP